MPYNNHYAKTHMFLLEFIEGYLPSQDYDQIEEHFYHNEALLGMENIAIIIINNKLIINNKIYNILKDELSFSFNNGGFIEKQIWFDLLPLVVSDEEYSRLQKEQGTQYPIKYDAQSKAQNSDKHD